MRRIYNPYRRLEGYNCFGCSPDNHHGLRMEFYEDGDEIVCIWEPGIDFQGYLNILHGGIQAALMDEIASWVVMVKMQTSGVTSRMESRFHKAVFTNQGSITIRGRLKEKKRNLALVHAELFDTTGQLCSQAEVTYFTFRPEVAKEKYKFPGIETFYSPDQT